MYVLDLFSGSRHQMCIGVLNLFSGSRHHVYIVVLTCSVVLCTKSTSIMFNLFSGSRHQMYSVVLSDVRCIFML